MTKEKKTPKANKPEGLTEWQKKVEADLNAMAARCYETRYLQINSEKPEFVDLNKKNKGDE
tara:strand:+ start:459 stop:641 length:183 start_codon:yes stop_codon:yes gene_type:complete